MRNSPSSARISVRRGSPYSAWTCAQLVDDDLHHELVAAQNREQPLDQLEQLRQLVEDLLAFETGQPLELHVENRLRLYLRQAELRDQALRARSPDSPILESAQ